MDILYGRFSGQAKNLPSSSLHRLTIGGNHNPVSVMPFSFCSSLILDLLNGQLGEIHICYLYVAIHILNCLRINATIEL